MIDARNKCSNKPLLSRLVRHRHDNVCRAWHGIAHALDVQLSGISPLPIQHLTGHHSSESGTISFAHSEEEMMRIPETHRIVPDPERP